MKKISSIFIIALALLFNSCAKKDFVPGSASTSSLANNNNAMFADPIANDPFTAYLTSVPTVLSTISTTNSGSGSTAITTKRFTFSSLGGKNVVYAIMSYPQAAGTYPAIMFNHGGGGNAETMAGNCTTYAALGYVTIAIDYPSIAGAGNTPNSTGPWKSDPSGTDAPKFNVTGGVTNCRLYDAGVAGLQAFNYMKSQANVNSAKMAISGTSWGGYMTTLLSGILGSQVKAAYAIYGCGFYDLGTNWTSREYGALSAADKVTWVTYFDAGRRCPFITAPYFIEQPTDDQFFWPEAVQGTLDAIPGTRNRVTMPNLNHMEISNGTVMKQTYMNFYLKGTGSAFGNISIASSVPQGDGSLQVNMNVSLASGTTVSSVQLYYSVPDASTDWQTRTWTSIAATLVSGTTYRAVIPAAQVNQNVNYYGYFTDSRTVVTSTPMLQTGYLDHCDVTTGWSGANPLTINTTDKKEGSGSLQSVGSGTDEFKKVFTTPYNAVGVTAAAGSIDFWYYVSDITKLSSSNQIEIGSGGASDVNEYNWNIGTLVNGWNHIHKTFSSAGITGGTPNLAAINWFRIYHSKTASITTKVDGIQILK
jgi:dienelactone hydrolase